MIDYNLNVDPILPISKSKPSQAIILCHGYGGDGKDISILAINWQRFLPDAVFLCPNAPEVCNINPQGYQWFDLDSENEKIIYERSLTAEDKLSKFLDQVLNNFKLEPSNLALVGFSQGCMIGIQTILKKKNQINCFLGYSGKIINKKYLENNIYSKPNIFLMHGAKDTIVPPLHLLEAKEFLINNGLKIKTKLFRDCEHKISIEGSSLGLNFLKKKLL